MVFEDSDEAPFEILSPLVALLEDQELYVAGPGEHVVVIIHLSALVFASSQGLKVGPLLIG